jgi:hypothetical protein
MAAPPERPRTASAVGRCVVLAVALRAPYLGIPRGRRAAPPAITALPG